METLGCPFSPVACALNKFVRSVSVVGPMPVSHGGFEYLRFVVSGILSVVVSVV